MVSDEETKKFDLMKSVLEYLKPYMNLELYQYEKKQEGSSGNTIVNSAFEYQSKIGRATGVMQSPKWVRDALAAHDAKIKQQEKKMVITSDDPNELG
jgi:hypothetical protein